MLSFLQQRARTRKIILPSLLVMVLAHACFAATESFDVVVYGATASGVMAAVGAAQEGMRVALAEPGRHVGGMLSGD